MIKSTISYIEEVLATHPEFKNESALARELHISRQAISAYRAGTNMSVYVAVKVAYMLDLNPMETIAASMYEQKPDDYKREFWLAEYRKAKRST